MYDFHKISQENRIPTFSHPLFYKGGKKHIGSIKRKMAKKEVKSCENEEFQKQLEENIKKFSIRLEQLEEKEKNYDSLKIECQKLQ